jgi:hypothetical protein
VQDTGFSDIIPTGEGLLAFNDEDDAVAQLTAVETNYSRHQAKAREISRAYFDSTVVLKSLLSRIGLG